MAYSLNINGVTHEVEVEGDTPLLWVLRDSLGLTGTKFGCGIQQCGACTVHIDGVAMRSCGLPVEQAVNAEILTIEGLSPDISHPAQLAWIELDVPQCGYCQSGMVMATAAMLEEIPTPTDEDIDTYVTNACRCGTYTRIRKAIYRAAELKNA